VYAFAEKKDSAWIKDTKYNAGAVVLVTGYDEDSWSLELNDVTEENHWIPMLYVQTKNMILKYDSLKGGMAPQKDLTAEEFQLLLQRAEIWSIRCWAKRAMLVNADILKEVKANSVAKYGGVAEEDRLPLEYYSRSFTRKFIQKNWAAIVKVAKESGKPGQVDTVWEMFSRGSDVRPNLFRDPDKGVVVERMDYVKSSTEVALSYLSRIGLSFIKVPGILQVQPYAQLMMAADVKQILSAIMWRTSPKGSSSKLQKFQRRLDKCQSCVTRGLAFCDRQAAANAMLLQGFDANTMDECMEKTVDNKIACERFRWDRRNVSGVGVIFAEEICPCESRASGNFIHPNWITTQANCKEMSLDGKEELDRGESKAEDWNSGFSTQVSTKHNRRKYQRLLLGDKLIYAGLKACQNGYRCCRGLDQGDVKFRCVHEESLKRTGFILENAAKCKHFRPNDLIRWGHERQSFQCAPTDPDNPSFQGYWHMNEDKKWEEVEGVPIPS